MSKSTAVGPVDVPCRRAGWPQQRGSPLAFLVLRTHGQLLTKIERDQNYQKLFGMSVAIGPCSCSLSEQHRGARRTR
jgi:hypothetical protein